MLKTLKVRKIHLTHSMAVFSAFFAFCVTMAVCVINVFAILGQSGFEISIWAVIGWNVFLGLLAASFVALIFSIFGLILGWLFSGFYNRIFCRRSSIELEVDCDCCGEHYYNPLMDQFKETDRNVIRNNLDEPRL